MNARPYRRALALVVVGALATVGCSSDEEPEPAPTSTEPSAAPSPTPPPIEDVEAEQQLTLTSLSGGPWLDRSQQTPPDEAAVDRLVAAVTRWLDDHLDDLEHGGSGQLQQVAAVGLLDEADPAVVSGATTGLTDREAPLRQVTYDLEVGHNGAPRWLRANVTVTRADQQTRSATFVFLPNDEGAVLVALEGGAA